MTHRRCRDLGRALAVGAAVAAAVAAVGCTTAWTRHMNHGTTAYWFGDPDRAVAHFEQALAHAGDDPLRRARGLAALGHALQRAGRPGQAEVRFRRSLALLEERAGDEEHPLLVRPLAGLAAVLREDPERADELEDVLERIVACHRARPEWAPEEGRERFTFGTVLADAGNLLLRAGRQAAAEEVYARAAPLLLETEENWRLLGQRALADYVALLRETGRDAEADALLASASQEPDYLRYVTFEAYGHEDFVTRWPVGKMPLRVHLPRPPEGMFRSPDAVLDSVRDGVLGWTDVAGPGVPSFTFVDRAADADIHIVWSPVSGDWFVAYAAYDVDLMTRRFGVNHVLVAAKYRDGTEVPLDHLYHVMLHEMGHALGLAGHSPDPGDVMFPYPTRRGPNVGLSDRDRATLRALYEAPIGRRVVGARRAD